MAIFTVTTADDIVDAGDGLVSLREAVTSANAASDADTINFAAGLSGSTLVLTGGEIWVTEDTSFDGDIDGDNKADIIISGNNFSRVFVGSGETTDMRIDSLVLRDGFTAGSGGAIAANINSLHIANSSIINNAADQFAGGINVKGASVEFANVLISENTSGSGGAGGVRFMLSSNAVLTNTTVDGNNTDGFGGGIYIDNSSSVSLYNSTVTDNLADADGTLTDRAGGINNFGAVHITNSVIAGNGSGGTLPAPVINETRNPVNSARNSFFGGYVEITTDNGGNTISGGDAGLGELLNNGGTTLTRSPLDASVLIGAGSGAGIPVDTLDVDGNGNATEALPVDGRGGLRIAGGAVDIGAVDQFVDEVIGGTDGDNVMIGGLGIDTATYEDASAGVVIYLEFTGLDTIGAGVDTLSGFEHLTGSAFNDRVAGDGNANVLHGGDGDDVIKGRGGNDMLFGDGGNDRITGASGDDTLSGDGGNDELRGLAGVDILNGGAGDDYLFGGSGIDTLNGDAGADNMRGNRGNDTLNGGAGDDIMRGGNNNDNLNGDDGNDYLFGENASDVIFGGAGNDSLTGGKGKGVLDNATDTFVYRDTVDGGGGFDRIKDFENGIDLIDLQSFGFADFAAVQTVTSDRPGGLRLDFGGGDVLFVEGFFLADFDAGDVLL